MAKFLVKTYIISSVKGEVIIDAKTEQDALECYSILYPAGTGNESTKVSRTIEIEEIKIAN